ncbi:MAG: Gfo/Idh/MocA family oxidoreductase [Armatimonadetes bacterium]|nr:Gfo/Idh/MocA family oxidoreductase [Armatimonadota bacterium]MDW8121439.1 Gfo/Idh/MocA family oxidoreductase [Armatimonadota bacterium]
MGPVMGRREFLKGSAGIGASLILSRSVFGANDRVGLGFIGVGPRGMGLLNEFKTFPDVEIIAVSDVYAPRVDQAVAATGGRAKGYSDFRHLLDRKDLDAVVIATPPHWHALNSVLACQAGKDVYCEKPMCLTVAEATAMLEAATVHKRVTQIGTQMHATENFHRVVEIIRSGILGTITMVRCFCNENISPNGFGHPPDSDPPEGLDWDFWCGPAPLRPFKRPIFERHYFFQDYAGLGLLHNMAPHILDLPFWALELKAPLAVTAIGGRFALTDCTDVPDTLEAVYDYGTLILTWTHSEVSSYGYELQGGLGIGRRLGIIFQGTNGTLFADYNIRKLVPEGDRISEKDLPPPSLPRSPGHTREWINAIKTRQECSCSYAYHYWIQLAISLGDIAYQVKQRIVFDDRGKKIIGNPMANNLLARPYRSPWKLPA